MQYFGGTPGRENKYYLLKQGKHKKKKNGKILRLKEIYNQTNKETENYLFKKKNQ